METAKELTQIENDGEYERRHLQTRGAISPNIRG